MKISNEALQKLKCDYGNHYLSQFPVYLTSDHKNVCGRCGNDSENSQRNVLYETLAEFVEFPCMFTDQGCTEVALPNKIVKHELNCTFKQRKCPVDGVIECKWQGTEMKIFEHCDAIHSDLMLENMEFVVELAASFNECRFLRMGSFLYKLNLKFYPITKLLEMLLMKIKIETVKIEKDYKKCQIVLESDSRQLIITYVFEQSGTIEILLDSIKDSKDVTKILGKLVFNKEDHKVDEVIKLDYGMLEHFKCNVCKKYALPPYPGNEQSVIRCEKCARTQCGYATQALLNKIAENVVFPCVNGNGCKFTSLPNVMKTHLIYCRYGTYKCPVSTYCNWNNFGSLIAQHITEKHGNEIIQSSIITEKLQLLPHYGNNSSLSRTYFYKFSNRFFKICCFFEKTQKYFWDVQETVASNSEFYFRMEFKNVDKRLICEEVCGPIIPMEDIIKKKKFFLTKEQIQDFIINDTITYQFDIYKK